MQVCVGGTFNIFHEGHKRLLDKCLELAGDNGSVHIGITVGDLINHKKNVNSYEFRKKSILDYIFSNKYKIMVEVLPIDTKYGFAVDMDYEVIVVSPETKINAEEINKKRRKLGKKNLRIVEIPFVLADDGKPISSTRILEKVITKEGKILTKKY